METTIHNGECVPDDIAADDIIHIRPLGKQGGLCTLFWGHKVGLDVDVVIKRAKRRYLNSMDDLREAHLLTSLHHRYLPNVYDVKRGSDGFNYTVMEYIPGCTLREYVRRFGAVEESIALKWVTQLCDVASYLHSHKPHAIIHSDLKPENIIIRPDRDICVIDFNTALQFRNEEEQLEAIGATPGYAAPEQFNLPVDRFPVDSPLRNIAAQSFGQVSTATDVYAIGALAYYMLTGFDPKLWTEDTISLKRYNISLSNSFRAIIEKAMQRDPSQRFKDGQAMLHALEHRGSTQPKKRGHTVAVIAAMVLLAAGVLFASSFLRVGRNDRYQTLLEEAEKSLREGDKEASIAALRNAVANKPECIDAYLPLGLLLYQEGNYEEVIALTEQSSALKVTAGLDEEQFARTSAELSSLTSDCFYITRQDNKALLKRQEAVYFQPENAAYQYALAAAFAREGQVEEAERTVIYARSIQSNPLGEAIVLGEIDRAQGLYDTAGKKLFEAAEATSDDALATRLYLDAADCCQSTEEGNCDGAVAILQSACGRPGLTGNEDLRIAISNAYLEKSKQNGVNETECYENALENLKTAAEYGGNSFELLQNTAAVLSYLKQYEAAEGILDQLERDYPDDYRVPLWETQLKMDRESEKPFDIRDYSSLTDSWKRAKELYQFAINPDAQMAYLEDAFEQLRASGYDI